MPPHNNDSSTLHSSSDFHSVSLSASLQQVIQELGYTKMTDIQARSIPLLLAGQDLIGQSKTGSGKTAAFALPILEKLKVNQPRLQALILCPTRELCAQVARDFRKLGRRHPGLRIAMLSGGTPLRPQATALQDGAHIAVGTPGRVIDHLDRETLLLDDIATIVLDEADRMLDMGFHEDMERILMAAPRDRQTVFFSATFPESIEAMSRAFQVDPVRVTIEAAATANTFIHQIYYEAAEGHKTSTLVAALKHHKPDAAIVFCNLKATTKEIARELTRLGMSAASLNGDLEQYERDQVLVKFRNRSTRVLVATDVAARGLDIEDLDIVFNVDLPSKPEIYVHRIGRTGRAGKKGLAVAVLTSREKYKLQTIEDFTKVKVMRKTLPVADPKTNSQASAAPREAAMATLRIGGGRKEKLRPGDILGALTGTAGGLPGAQIGKIEIHDHLAYVAVAKSIAQTALQCLQNGRIKGRKFKVELMK